MQRRCASNEVRGSGLPSRSASLCGWRLNEYQDRGKDYFRTGCLSRREAVPGEDARRVTFFDAEQLGVLSNRKRYFARRSQERGSPAFQTDHLAADDDSLGGVPARFQTAEARRRTGYTVGARSTVLGQDENGADRKIADLINDADDVDPIAYL